MANIESDSIDTEEADMVILVKNAMKGDGNYNAKWTREADIEEIDSFSNSEEDSPIEEVNVENQPTPTCVGIHRENTLARASAWSSAIRVDWDILAGLKIAIYWLITAAGCVYLLYLLSSKVF